MDGHLDLNLDDGGVVDRHLDILGEGDGVGQHDGIVLHNDLGDDGGVMHLDGVDGHRAEVGGEQGVGGSGDGDGAGGRAVAPVVEAVAADGHGGEGHRGLVLDIGGATLDVARALVSGAADGVGVGSEECGVGGVGRGGDGARVVGGVVVPGGEVVVGVGRGRNLDGGEVVDGGGAGGGAAVGVAAHRGDGVLVDGEVGRDGGVVGEVDGDGALGRVHAVAPAGEVVAVVGGGGEGGRGAEVILAAAGGGAHGLAGREGGHAVGVGQEDGDDGGIPHDDDVDAVLGAHVNTAGGCPVVEGVALGGMGLHVGGVDVVAAVGVGVLAGDGAAALDVGIVAHVVEVAAEDGFDAGVLGQLEGVDLAAARLVGEEVLVAPLVEVVADGGLGGEGNPGEVGISVSGSGAGGIVAPADVVDCGGEAEGVGLEAGLDGSGLGEGQGVLGGHEGVGDGVVPAAEEVAVVRRGGVGRGAAALGRDLDGVGGADALGVALDVGVTGGEAAHGQAGADTCAALEGVEVVLCGGHNVIAVDAEADEGGGILGEGEGQARAVGEERCRLGDEVVAVGDVGGGVFHAVGVAPALHMVQLGGVGHDGHLGAVVNDKGSVGQLSDAFRELLLDGLHGHAAPFALVLGEGEDGLGGEVGGGGEVFGDVQVALLGSGVAVDGLVVVEVHQVVCRVGRGDDGDISAVVNNIGVGGGADVDIVGQTRLIVHLDSIDLQCVGVGVGVTKHEAGGVDIRDGGPVTAETDVASRCGQALYVAESFHDPDTADGLAAQHLDGAVVVGTDVEAIVGVGMVAGDCEVFARVGVRHVVGVESFLTVGDIVASLDADSAPVAVVAGEGEGGLGGEVGGGGEVGVDVGVDLGGGVVVVADIGAVEVGEVVGTVGRGHDGDIGAVVDDIGIVVNLGNAAADGGDVKFDVDTLVLSILASTIGGHVKRVGVIAVAMAGNQPVR